MHWLLKLFVGALCLFAMGCGVTRIRSQDPSAEILLDGQSLGKGEVTVSRLGPPHTASLEARRGGKQVGYAHMSRSFSGWTILWGLCSYYTGFYWGWYYPESVLIPMTDPISIGATGSREDLSLWSHPRESVWMKPMHSQHP